MIVDGQEIPAREWSLPEWEPLIFSKGYLAFEGMESNIPVGEAAMGYRIFYQTPTGDLHPPVTYLDQFKRWDEGESQGRGTTQAVGRVNHSPTDEGYYYWANKEVAAAYLFTIGADMYNKYKNIPTEQLPSGQFVMRTVRGTATRHPSGQAGDVMEDMSIDGDDIYRLSWSELFS